MIWCIKTYIIAYVKTQKNKIYYPLLFKKKKKKNFKRWTNMQEASG